MEDTKWQANLESAGVRTNRMPWDDTRRERAYNSVDGLMDKVVPAQPVPEYREKGLADQERPLHFLLDEDPNGTPASQADAINRVFGHGDLDVTPQDSVLAQSGLEVSSRHAALFPSEPAVSEGPAEAAAADKQPAHEAASEADEAAAAAEVPAAAEEAAAEEHGAEGESAFPPGEAAAEGEEPSAPQVPEEGGVLEQPETPEQWS
mmetsp:Transcript_76323/g.205134  ORF Transcript_76323/g.205134 Transcript_76323/m.205134 type:complete len:206 (-) Transcript_76323:4111-4728(-)